MTQATTEKNIRWLTVIEGIAIIIGATVVIGIFQLREDTAIISQTITVVSKSMDQINTQLERVEQKTDARMSALEQRVQRAEVDIAAIKAKGSNK